ncbi:S8 family peptidase, partial [Stenotrophomonas maltophilia]
MRHMRYLRPLHSSRPAPLAFGITFSLMLTTALPAMASESFDAWQRQRQLQAAWAQPGGGASAAPTATTPAAASTSVLGNPGDAASWRSDEFNADWGLGAMGADYAYARGLTGKGVRLALFDSGSALAHPEFAARNTSSVTIGADCATQGVVAGAGACGQTRGEQPGYNYYGLGAGVPASLAARLIAAGRPYGFSYDDHGTHVLGTIGANRNGTGMHGVAFGADLTAARVFGDTYYEWRLDPDNYYRPRAVYRTDPDDAATLDMYAQIQAQGVRAINHSWGSSTRNMSAAALDQQYASTGAGYGVYGSIYANNGDTPGSTLIQVWAAGNGSGAVAGIAASMPRWKPELEPYWLAVANVRRPNAAASETDYVIDGGSSICGVAANWCISAPGTDIASTIVSGDIQGRIENTSAYLRLIIDSENTQYVYGTKTGTSMAAPHITGALGLLMERFPYLDNAQVRDVLLTTARDLGAAGIDPIYGWGMVDLKKAIEGYGS